MQRKTKTVTRTNLQNGSSELIKWRQEPAQDLPLFDGNLLAVLDVYTLDGTLNLATGEVIILTIER